MKIYKSRTEVPEQEKWQLEDIFPALADWEQAFDSVDAKVETFRAFDGNISDGNSLFEFLTISEETNYLFKKLYVYAMLHADIDTRNSASQSILDRAKQLSVKLSTAKAFFMPFLLSLDEQTLKDYIKSVEGLKYFEKDLYEAYRYKEHVLSKDQEEILSQLGDALSSPSSTFGMINNADIKFGVVTNDEGEKVELTRGMYAKLIEQKDRKKRLEAYKAYYKPYVQLQNTIASTLSQAIKNNVMVSKLRNYPSAVEKSLFDDEVPLDVYNNLIETTKKHIEPLHRYAKIRKQFLGVDELRAYDLSVPLVEEVKDTISFDEAYETMLKSLEPLGKDYVDTLQCFKEKRYFDVRETPGKRSGAYNIGVYGVHPFVLLNHQDDLNSLFTLVHESGHAMHSWYSSKHQPQISAGYTIFVAEVASTVNEILLIRYLLKITTDNQMKRRLLNHFIDGFKGTFFTQVMFSEFEKLTHEKAEKGEPLNASVFNELYESIFTTYNGDEIVLDEEVKYGWSRIPHFYRPFYVYKYATGYASAIYIADKILEEDQEMLTNYLQFLKSGSSDYPLELLKKTGVDLTKPEFIENTLAIFGDLVDEFAKS
ncbi:oligoendopeptidase F [bacterium LRH843]|nr:oligoendopeptidase F [bacterium LRH843]